MTLDNHAILQERTETLRSRLIRRHIAGESWASLERAAGCGAGTLRKFAAGQTAALSLPSVLKGRRLGEEMNP